MKITFVLTLALLPAVACLSGCGADGQVPAVDDVAQAAPEAGLVGAWSGETETAPASEEPEAAGPRVERNEMYDENGVLCGYDVCEYDELDRITLEEQFDSDGNSINRWERSYSEDGLECVTWMYSAGEFNSKLVTRFDERGETCEQRLYDTGDALLSLSYYDENGGISLTENYIGEAGAEWKSSEITYGENGSVEERMFAPDGSPESVWRREYDENNRNIRDLAYEGGSFKWDHRYTYDGQGLCIRMDFFDENEELLNYTRMEYTPTGLLLAEEEYTAEDVMTARKVWERAADGRVLARHHYDGEGKIVEYTLVEYDEFDRICREESFNADDESLGYATYRYAEDGSYELRSHYSDNRLAYRESYDAEGNLIERIDAS